MKFYVGTSGWMYEWNRGGNLKWYVENSGLNAIELNYSFYRFPSSKQVKSWISAGSGLSWSVKVNRTITQMFKLNMRAERSMSKFLDIFSPMDSIVDNYLFQLPPNFTSKFKDRVFRIVEKFKLNEKAVIEPRHVSWFNDTIYLEFKDRKICMTSIDSPIGNFYVRTSDKIYLRMHGRRVWYTYRYSNPVLRSVFDGVKALGGRKAFVFFNNDHSMLSNARYMSNLPEKRG